MTPAYRLVRSLPPPPPPPELDAEQRHVVAHPGGPLLVLAGPGTGKTTTLVEAVVARVERGAEPDRVLVLTFSRKAADELRERIALRIGRTVREPAAFTFHSWCFAVLRSFDPPVPRLLSEAERDVRVHDLLLGDLAGDGSTRWPSELFAALPRRGFAREVADLIDRARERGLGAGGLRTLGEREKRPAWRAAGDFLDEYLAVLDRRGEIDYSGLIRRVIDLLRAPVGEEIRGRYDAVFVDEFQDTDPAQEELLAELAGGGRDLGVVGDPDQSIYAFRGADVRGILDFPARFRTASGVPTRVIALAVSRRAGEEILAPARAVAQRLPLPGLDATAVRRHRSSRAVGPPATAPPEIRIFPTVAEEVTAIADLLRRAHVQDGVPWAEMAVLVRSGQRSIPVLRRAFVAAGVPVAVAADEVPVARDPTVAPLLAALRVAAAGWSTLTVEDAHALLLSPLGRALPSGVRVLGRRLRALERAGGVDVPRPSGVLVAEALADPRDLVGVEEWWAEPVRRVHDVITRTARILEDGGSPEEALWELWDASGWAARAARDSAAGGAAGRSADRDLDAVLALFAAAGRLEHRQPRAGVGALLDELAAQVVPTAPAEERGVSGEAVRLLTAHRAKGLEWDVVVVADVQHGVWPDVRRRGSLLDASALGRDGVVEPPSPQAMLVDERRLFYVALTRARRRLLVTAVASVSDSGERPSRFLEEMGLEMPATTLAGTALLSPASLVARLRRVLADESASSALRDEAARLLAELAGTRDENGEPLVPAADPERWWGLRPLTPGRQPVRDPDQPLRLSASAVAAFEQCPLRAFLDREAHAKTTSSPAQGFGMVVHGLAQAVSEGTLPADPDVLMARLDEVWPALAFEAPWIADRERAAARRALEVLLRWLDERQRTYAGAERNFEMTWRDEVVLSGAVDRLERGDDGRVHVIDLKTGKTPKRQVEVENDAQLGVYQVVARDGGLDAALGDDPVVLGGAELVYLRKETAAGRPSVRLQDPLPPAPSWVDELLQRTRETLREEQFPARPGPHCERCPFRSSCPAQDEGTPVIA